MKILRQTLYEHSVVPTLLMSLIYYVVDESSKDHQYTMLYGSDKTETINVS